uniref:Hypothetical secreted peptide n=1 Tax=Glossina morsitans morsitans TaxID=37546 RepID=D3TSJ6_GLOMM
MRVSADLLFFSKLRVILLYQPLKGERYTRFVIIQHQKGGFKDTIDGNLWKFLHAVKRASFV